MKKLVRKTWTRDDVNLLKVLLKDPETTWDKLQFTFLRNKDAIVKKIEKLGLDSFKDRSLKRHENSSNLSSIIADYLNGMNCYQLQKKYNTGHGTIGKLLKKNGITLREDYKISAKKYSLNEAYFDKIDSKEKAYWLGLLYSDGNISNDCIRISLQEGDRDILERFKICLNYTNSLKTLKKRNENHQNQTVINIYSKYMCEKLALLGVVENKTFKLSFPRWLPEEYLKSFILGYFDGDGGIYNPMERYLHMSFTGYKPFIEDLQEYLISTIDVKRAKFHIRFPERENLIGSINYSTQSCIKFSNWIYKGETLFMERKFNKFKKINNKTES